MLHDIPEASGGQPPGLEALRTGGNQKSGQNIKNKTNAPYWSVSRRGWLQEETTWCPPGPLLFLLSQEKLLARCAEMGVLAKAPDLCLPRMRLPVLPARSVGPVSSFGACASLEARGDLVFSEQVLTLLPAFRDFHPALFRRAAFLEEVTEHS